MLWVKGGNMMLGYYNDRTLSKSTLVNGWLKTGDSASINEYDCIKIKGRADDVIIRTGMNIYSAEIEGGSRTAVLIML